MWRSSPTWGAAPGSPWQNAYCERLIGSIRRECLDHLFVLNERHLLHVLRNYTSYYHASWTHRAHQTRFTPLWDSTSGQLTLLRLVFRTPEPAGHSAAVVSRALGWAPPNCGGLSATHRLGGIRTVRHGTSSATAHVTGMLADAWETQGGGDLDAARKLLDGIIRTSSYPTWRET